MLSRNAFPLQIIPASLNQSFKRVQDLMKVDFQLQYHAAALTLTSDYPRLF